MKFWARNIDVVITYHFLFKNTVVLYKKIMITDKYSIKLKGHEHFFFFMQIIGIRF